MFGKRGVRWTKFLLVPLLAMGLAAPAVAHAATTSAGAKATGLAVHVVTHDGAGCISATRVALGAAVYESKCSAAHGLVLDQFGENFQLRLASNTTLAIGYSGNAVRVVKSADHTHSYLYVAGIYGNDDVFRFVRGSRLFLRWNGVGRNLSLTSSRSARTAWSIRLGGSATTLMSKVVRTAAASGPSTEIVAVHGIYGNGCMSATKIALGATVEEVKCSAAAILLLYQLKQGSQLRPLKNTNLAFGVSHGHMVLIRASDVRNSIVAEPRVLVGGKFFFALRFTNVGSLAWVIWNGSSVRGHIRPLTLATSPTVHSAMELWGCAGNPNCVLE